MPSIEFQCTSWYAADDPIEKNYEVHIFGRTLQGRSVCLHVQDFHPSFLIYIKDCSRSGVAEYEMLSDVVKKRLARFYVDGEKQDYSDHFIENDDFLVQGKSLWGFTNNEKRRYIRLSFTSHVTYKRMMNMFRDAVTQSSWDTRETFHEKRDRLEKDMGKLNYKLYQVLDPMLLFSHTQNLRMSGWVTASHLTPPDDPVACTKEEWCVTYTRVNKLERDEICKQLVEMAFDIETYSFDETFPDPEIPANQVFQIGITLKKYSDTKIEKVLLQLGPCASIPGTNIVLFQKESELLLAFTQFILKHDPDLIYSYNGDKFDWSYLVKRAELLGITEEFMKLSRLSNYECKLEEKMFSSSAFGDNKYLCVDVPGRLTLDILIFLQRGQKQYSNYKLDTIAEIELGQNKDPVHFKEIFRSYKSKDPVRIAVTGKYCVQDTALVQLLVDKLDVVTQLVEMSNITFVPVMFLMRAGQSIKAYSQVVKKANEMGFLVPHATDRDEEKFQGARVLEPLTGAYDTPVAVLDFASLYPTIQMGYNICYSTVVMENKYLNLKGVKYETIEWLHEESGETLTIDPEVGIVDLDEDDEEVVPVVSTTKPTKERRKFKYVFVQDVQSVIPALQKELFDKRKNVKRLKRECPKEDNLRFRVLSGRELAIKVSMNSIYGFTATFKLQYKPLASCVTAIGRKMIDQTKAFMEKDFPKIAYKEGLTKNLLKLTCIGGDTDSVFINFPSSTINETIALTKRAEVLLTDNVFNRHPIRMEYEKVYLPYIYQKKKNYIGKMFTDNDTDFTVDYKGIAIKRRNYCPFMKNVFWSVITEVLDISKTTLANKKEVYTDRKQNASLEEGVAKALKVLETSLRALETGSVDPSDFVITAKLSRHYKNDNLPHVQLAKRMKWRDPGSEPKEGERFGYIITCFSTKSAQLNLELTRISKNLAPLYGEELYQRAEDPDFVKENGLDIDGVYYLEKQVGKPLTTFFELFCKEKEIRDILGKSKDKCMRRAALVTSGGIQSARGLQDIGSFFKSRDTSTLKPTENPNHLFHRKKKQKKHISCQKLGFTVHAKDTSSTGTNDKDTSEV